MLSGDELQFLVGGGAISLVAVYLSKAVLALAQSRGLTPKSKPSTPPPKETMISLVEAEQLREIYREIENSHSDREEMLRILRKLHELVRELHGWHNQRDEDGVLKWLNKPSVERRIARIEKIIEGALKKSSSGRYSFDLRGDKKP